MIAQARITSDTSATVYLHDESVELDGETVAEVRARVKQVFIDAARKAEATLPVLIVEPDAVHHLQVETTGRIASRTPDGSPVFGPTPDGVDLRSPAPADDPVTATGAPDDAASSPEAHPHETHPHRTDDLDSAPTPPTAGREEDAPTAHSPLMPAPREAEVVRPRPSGSARPGRRSAAVSGTDTHPDTGTAAAVAQSTEQEIDMSASPAAPAPSGPPATSGPSAPGPSAPGPSAPGPSAPGLSAPGPSAPDAASAPARDAASAPAPEAAPLPTLEDLRSASAPVEDAPATRGWQGFITRLTGRRIAPRPHPRELQEREFQARIRRPVDASKNIVVVNLKGGAHKTTASLMIAATLGLVRGGSVVAWDNNETRGTLGWRGHQADHHATAVDLLHDMDELNSPGATVAQLDRYMRPQTQSQFDILASDDNPGSAAFVDASAFDRLNDLLSRFYRMKVIDTGNNVRASNWLAAVESADQLVIISTIREDTFNAAAWMIDELRATGYADKVDQAVTVLSQSSPKKVDPVLHKRLLQHFGAHTRAVHEVPFERQFVDGSTLDWSRISPATKNAWLAATASIVAGL